MSLYTQDRQQSAVPTPRVNGPMTGPGETPKPRAGRSKYGHFSTQKFQIAHQQVNLDVDICKKRIVGYTELSVVPTSTSLRTIRLDAREMSIKRVLINGSESADYVYNDQLYINDPKTFEECAQTRVPNIWDRYSNEFSIHQHHLLRQKLSYIFGHLDDDQNSVGEKGESLNTEELTIFLPDTLKMELADVNAIQHTPTSAMPTSSLTPMHLRLKSGTSEVYNPIQIGIEYEIINPKDGLNFICNAATEKHMWHVYTSNSEHNVSASSWVPCIDSLLERSSWSIELSIPRTVRDIVENSETPKTNKHIKVKEQTEDQNADKRDKEDDDAEKSNNEDTQMNDDTEMNGATEMNGDTEMKDADASDVEIVIEEDDDDRENYDLFVCSGDVNNTKESPHPTDLSKKLVSWSVFNPVCAHHIGWAVGAYQSFELSDFNDGSAQLPESEEEFEAMEKDETSSSVSLFYLPGQEELVKNTCIFAQKALEFFSKEYGSYPFSSYGIAFVQEPRYPKNNFAGLSLLSAELLYPATIIEPMFSTTEDILECIAGQWSGISIVPLTFNDLWCTIGIAKFMTFQFTKTLVGSNEYRYQIKQKMSSIVEQDVGQRPLGLQALQAPISEFSFDFIRLKAPIILFILDRRMTKTDKSFGFTRVLPKLFLQAMSGDLQNGALSTSHFQYVCEKVNRNRLESFFKQWVFGVGTPIFNITQKFNKKRSIIEVVIRQSQLQQAKTPHPRSETFVRDAVSLLNQEQTFPVQQTFLGPMTIRVHEADGTPYEHIVDIKDKVVKFDVQYNTKFKKLKKSKDENGEGASVFSKLGDVLQGETDVKKWHFEEWPKRDEEFLDPFEWLRVDTDFEWIATFNLKQPDYMFGSQLQQDRDIEAQINACEFFGYQEKASIIHCTMLTRTLMDRRYFYGVRIAAAKALASVSRSANQFTGLNYLIQAFKSLYCFDNSSIPKSNNFQDFGEFFVQKAIPEIIAEVKDEHGTSPAKVKALLYNLLKYNDNSNNDFEDCYYMSTLVKALVKSVIPVNEDGSIMETHSDEIAAFENESKDQKFIKKVIEEIERSQKLDIWVPSYQLIVSSTCLEQKILMARSNLCTLTFEELLHLTHSKNTSKQRLLAFEGLFLLGGLKNAEVLKYFLHVCLLENSSAHFQAGMIRALVKSISEAAIQGLPSTLDDPEFKSSEDQIETNGKLATQSNMVVVEESQTSEMNSRRDAFARATVKGAIEVLRRDLAIGVGLQNTLWELLHTSLLSLNDRKAIFILCDILYEAVASFPVTIPVPCVPFEDLKKKIVAKISAPAREATRGAGCRILEEPPAPPKLKLKISSVTAPKPKGEKRPSVDATVLLKPREEKRPSVDASAQPLVSRDLKNRMQLKFKLNKKRLSALKKPIKVRNTVSYEGSVVKIAFGKSEHQQKLVSMRPLSTKSASKSVSIKTPSVQQSGTQASSALPPSVQTSTSVQEPSAQAERPHIFVRISTKGKPVEVSKEPFAERKPKNGEIGEDQSRRERDSRREHDTRREKEKREIETRRENGGVRAKGEQIDRVRGPTTTHALVSPIVEKLEPAEIVKHNLLKEEKQKLASEKTDRLSAPRPYKKSPSEEPVPDRSRAASPFSRDQSPIRSTKRKKTKIYIHGQTATPSPKGSNNETKAHSASSKENEANVSRGTDVKAETVGGVSSASSENGVSGDPADEPKRKFKLKLSMNSPAMSNFGSFNFNISKATPTTSTTNANTISLPVSATSKPNSPAISAPEMSRESSLNFLKLHKGSAEVSSNIGNVTKTSAAGNVSSSSTKAAESTHGSEKQDLINIFEKFNLDTAPNNTDDVDSLEEKFEQFKTAKNAASDVQKCAIKNTQEELQERETPGHNPQIEQKSDVDVENERVLERGSASGTENVPRNLDTETGPVGDPQSITPKKIPDFSSMTIQPYFIEAENTQKESEASSETNNDETETKNGDFKENSFENSTDFLAMDNNEPIEEVKIEMAEQQDHPRPHAQKGLFSQSQQGSREC
ncbi:hypothetical protein JCM33374_g1518 [Metschnikowia sp. JCM 33374]|nr:hypothetical protein JCM33374_g1518 [Metschnikowia sp. JCM 33374]